MEITREKAPGAGRVVRSSLSSLGILELITICRSPLGQTKCGVGPEILAAYG